MKVLMINGSPRANGNTARALKEVTGTLAAYIAVCRRGGSTSRGSR